MLAANPKTKNYNISAQANNKGILFLFLEHLCSKGKNPFYTHFSVFENIRLARVVPQERPLECDDRYSQYHEGGVVAYEVLSKVCLQEQVHHVAHGPGQEDCADAGAETMRIYRHHVADSCHRILTEAEDAAHDGDAQETPAHEKTVMHAYTR
jgi:hypothetical protein